MKTDNLNPVVSVIMPVYNAEEYLHESVGSVISQTFRNFELICFNDASTDRSIEILRDFADKDGRVKIIDSEVNVRQGGGRNRAIGESRGRYIMFLDADDSLRSDALQKCVEAAERHGSQCVFFDYSRFSPSTGLVEAVRQLGDDAAGLSGDELRRRVIERTSPVWTAMYDCSVIVDNGLWFPEGVFYEDNAVALAMQLVANKPVKINEALYNYRFDNPSVTRSNNNQHFFDRIGSAVALLDNLKRLGVYDRFGEEIDYLFINQFFVHTVFGAIYRFDRVQTERIRQVKNQVKQYVPGYKRNRYYKAQPLSLKIKIATHVRFPRLIKALSNLNRRLHLVRC